MKYKKCPHCGSDKGIYTNSMLRRIKTRMLFNGEEKDNSEMYDNASYYGGGFIYCENCDKRICRTDTQFKEGGV